VPVLCPSVLEAVRVNDEVPALVGVPLMSPVMGSNANPGGTVPEVIAIFGAG